MRYLVVVEQGPTSFGAYVPDLPGCVAAGETKAEALKLIREAIDLHISDLKSEGREVPRPTSVSEVVEVEAAQPHRARERGPPPPRIRGKALRHCDEAVEKQRRTSTTSVDSP